MKYLIWLVIVFAGLWWIRQKRQSSSDNPSPKNAKAQRGAQTPHDDTPVMVPCAHCGAHVPEADVTTGKHGVYCSEAHRQRQEG